MHSTTKAITSVVLMAALFLGEYSSIATAQQDGILTPPGPEMTTRQLMRGNGGGNQRQQGGGNNANTRQGPPANSGGPPANAGPQGQQHGMRGGGGGGNGAGRDSTNPVDCADGDASDFFGPNSSDMQTIQNLLDHHQEISHNVSELKDGGQLVAVQTNTTSSTPQVSKWIQEHVAQMMRRIENDQKLRAWDPLFETLFQRKDELYSDYKNTTSGVLTKMTWSTDCGMSLVTAHAYLIKSFLDYCRAEMRNAHKSPSQCDTV